MMKYLAIALFAAVIALFPYVLGKMSVSDTLERYRNACYDLSINARPFLHGPQHGGRGLFPGSRP